jgi:hypothetical protein
MGLAFSRVQVETRDGPRSVVLVEPDGDVVIRRDRLERMRAGKLGSTADETITRAVAEFGKIDAVVFRSHTEHEGDAWRFDDDLTDEEARELAGLFIKAHLDLYRKIHAAGACALVGVDFGEREAVAYAAGLDALEEELERKLAECEDEDEAADLRLGLWFAQRQGNWSTMTWQEMLAGPLADRILQAERQVARLRQFTGDEL